MSYKDKVLKKELFVRALTTLADFALGEPKLPLNNRRAIVASIQLGESVKYKQNKEQQPFSKNYQKVYQGLHNAFATKISNETDEKLKHAICTIASLAAWAGSNPDKTDPILEAFAMNIVPEDSKPDTGLSPLEVIRREFRKELGMEKSFDFLTIPLEQFQKKYHQR